MDVWTSQSGGCRLPCVLLPGFNRTLIKTKMNMKKRLLARMQILLLLLFLHAALFAQQKRSISGKVTDAKDGSPLQGVTVQPKGSLTGGTVTGMDGSFTITVG